MRNQFYLLLSVRSLTEGQKEKNYMLKINQVDIDARCEIDNLFVHNYEYIYKLWPCDLHKKQTISIEIYQKYYDNFNRQVIVKRGDSQPQVICSFQGEKFKFYGDQSEDCVVVLNFRVQSLRNIEKEISHQQLKQLNLKMQDHLVNCKQELHQYQQFLTYTSNVIKQLNNQNSPQKKHSQKRQVTQEESLTLITKQSKRLQEYQITKNQKQAQQNQSPYYLKNNYEEALTPNIKQYHLGTNREKVEEKKKTYVYKRADVRVQDQKIRTVTVLNKQIYLDGIHQAYQHNKQAQKFDPLVRKSSQSQGQNKEQICIQPQQKIVDNKPIGQELVQKELFINEVNPSEQIKRKRQMYLCRKPATNQENQPNKNHTKQIVQYSIVPNLRLHQQALFRTTSDSRSPDSLSIQKSKLRKSHSKDKQIYPDPIGSRQNQSQINHLPKKIQKQLSIIERSASLKPSAKQRVSSSDNIDKAGQYQKSIVSEFVNKGLEEHQIQKESHFQYPCRRKKLCHKNMPNTKTDRTLMGQVEQMAYNLNQYSTQSSARHLNQRLNLFITSVKAVLYKKHRLTSRKCIIQIQNNIFKTQPDSSNSNVMQWQTKFKLGDFNGCGSIYCRILSFRDEDQIQQARCVIGGKDILCQKNQTVKSYLYCEDLAVGYIELELENALPKQQARNSTSLPQIKNKGASLDYANDKSIFSRSKKSVLGKFKNQSSNRYCQTQQQRQGMESRGTNILSKIKQKKMKLRAKFK